MITGLATGFWIVTSPWTLQAFVPEPYFLRTLDQLNTMSTPNGLGVIECSLSPFFLSLGTEAGVLLGFAFLAWCLKNLLLAILYLLGVLAMAGITLWRLGQGFNGPM